VPKHPDSARPAHGGRFSPAGPGAGLDRSFAVSVSGEQGTRERGEAMPRLCSPEDAFSAPGRLRSGIGFDVPD